MAKKKTPETKAEAPAEIEAVAPDLLIGSGAALAA